MWHVKRPRFPLANSRSARTAATDQEAPHHCHRTWRGVWPSTSLSLRALSGCPSSNSSATTLSSSACRPAWRRIPIASYITITLQVVGGCGGRNMWGLGARTGASSWCGCDMAALLCPHGDGVRPALHAALLYHVTSAQRT